MKIILASQSPRRAAILKLAKIDFEVLPSKYIENLEDFYDIEEKSKELAYGKALNVFNNTQGDRTIIGSDTLVTKDDKIYGKPKDRAEAIRMLKELQGGDHMIYTSIAVLIERDGEYKEIKEVCKSAVTVSPMTDMEIIEYVDSEEPYDKAGAYAIQSCFSKYIDNISGSYMGIVGLPIDRIYKILKENELL